MNLVEFIGRLQGARQSGAGWVARCPNPGHGGGKGDSSPSLSVAEGSDGRVLVKCHGGCEVAAVVAGMGLNMKDLMPVTTVKEQRRLVCSYPYRSAGGEVLYRVNRYEPKDFRPQIPDGRGGWKFGLNGTTRVLFRLPEVMEAVKGGRTVYVTDGEKDVLALEGVGLVATTNAGGSMWKWTKEFAEPLRGASVVVIADKDQPGRIHAKQIADTLKGVAASVRIVEVPEGKDAADFLATGKTGADIEALVGEIEEAGKDDDDDDDDAEAEGELGEPPFRCLGETEEGFWYMTVTEHVLMLKATEHTRANLKRLTGGSMDYWRSLGKKWPEKAEGQLMAMQARTPMFEKKNVRGRGCWIDDGKVVYHTGESLLVDGKEVRIRDFKSRYIYMKRPYIPVDLSVSLEIEVRRRVAAMCALLPWASKSWGWVLPAWLYIAPVCGALDWRPHLWLTGPAISGKSWTYKYICSPWLGEAALKVQSSTTEAGIRQDLNSDAWPVDFDEFEQNDMLAMFRIHKVIELLRQASCDSGSGISKGSASGKAVRYLVKSMFLMHSIATSGLSEADESRVTVVGFYHREDQKPFEELKAIWKETLAKPEVCDQLRTSAISRAREIREAAQVFKMAIVEASSDSRAGDQYGALAAGYWLLTNDTMPTPEDAKAWAATIPWKRKGDTTKADDSVQCLNTLLEQVVSFSDDSGDRSVRRDRTIGELLESCRQNLPEKGVCKEVLRRYGIDPKTDRKHFDVAKKHAGLAKLMEKTRFNDGRWTQFLEHLPGADADNIRISLYKQRSIPSVRVPYSAIQHEWSDE